MNNHDSLIHVLSDSIKVLNLQHSIWHDFRLWDTNLLIVLATIISILATSIIQFYLHRRTYRDEYYKKVINKRFQTYELIEKLLHKLILYEIYNSKKFHNLIFENWKDSYSEFRSDLLIIGANSYWLSDKINKKISDLNDYLLKNIVFSEDSKLEGIHNFDNLNLFCSQIETILAKDLKHLHKVIKFINGKNSKLKKLGKN